MFFFIRTEITQFYAADDMENQTAVRLSREADPDGERTIG
jgi:hypothetical protein